MTTGEQDKADQFTARAALVMKSNSTSTHSATARYPVLDRLFFDVISRKFAMTPHRLIPVVILLAGGLQGIGLTQESPVNPESDSKSESQSTKVTDEISKVLKANYKAMEEKKSESALSHYHPKTNLISTKEQLDHFFSQTDLSYSITNIRYIGSDQENFVIIFREVTEFRRKGEAKLVSKVDTDVLMVFRKHDGKYKIFTSRSLKPGL